MRNEFRRRSYHNMAIEHDHLEKTMNYRSSRSPAAPEPDYEQYRRERDTLKGG